MKNIGLCRPTASRLVTPITLTVAIAVLGCDAFGVSSDNDKKEDTESDISPWRHDDPDTGFVTDDGIIYPGVNWPSADPEDEGMDGDLLEHAADLAEEEDSHCFVVTRGGKIVGEWYYNDWDPSTAANVFSVTKSITSLVVGVAETQKLLDIEQFASEFIPDWQDTESEKVLIRHLLSNTSGRTWDLVADYVELTFQTDKTTYALSVGQSEDPGAYWEYNNTAVQVLDKVLKEAVDGPVDTFANEHLFTPIGSRSVYTQDSSNNTVTYSDLKSSCRDLARFGYLVLRDGKWGDEQIIKASYIEEATSPSSELNTAYGYLWWLNQDGHWVAPATSEDAPRDEGEGKMLPTVPEHIVLAKGFQSQMIVIDKENDLVFTRIGGEEDPVTAFEEGVEPESNEFIGGLINRVLAAVTEPLK